MRAAAETLYIGRIGGGGAGLLGGLLARLLIGRLLLRRLLRIRGLAASRREGSPGNDGNDRQFRKCDASRARGLLTPIISHGWPFSGFTRGPLFFQRPRTSPLQYVPKLRHRQKSAF